MRRAHCLLMLALGGASLLHGVAARPAEARDESVVRPVGVTSDDIRDALLQRVADRAKRVGLTVDTERVRLVVTPALPPQALWSIAPVSPALTSDAPLGSSSVFSLRRIDAVPADDDVVYRAMLRAPLQRVVWVTQQRQARGSALHCEALSARAIDVQRVPVAALAMDCPWREGTVALRDLGAGEVVRASDAGVRPTVAARESVRVRSGIAGVVVEAQGVALSDGARGDRLMVRLSHPQRLVSAVVTEPGMVQVAGEAP